MALVVVSDNVPFYGWGFSHFYTALRWMILVFGIVHSQPMKYWSCSMQMQLKRVATFRMHLWMMAHV